LLALVRELRPELAIVDIRMPPAHATEGIDAAGVIREELHPRPVGARRGRGRDGAAQQRTRDRLPAQEPGDRVARFIDTVQRIVEGGSVVDPALVEELVASRRRDDPLDALTPREREVLALMAEGRSNAGIGRLLWVTEGTVEKHVRSILSKLPLADTPAEHRRVLAVITFLEAR
jgi:DNA-binding NarL/FixJ family response regulator